MENKKEVTEINRPKLTPTGRKPSQPELQHQGKIHRPAGVTVMNMDFSSVEARVVADNLRSILQYAHCLAYNDFIKVLDLFDGYYAKEKYHLMQTDFSKWYCSLDSGNADRFVKATLNKGEQK